MPNAVSAVQTPVERFFQFSLLGMLTCGYLAVATSGYLDWPTTILTGAGLLLRAMMVAGLVRFAIPASWATAATLGYVGFYPLDYFYISRDLVTASVHMVFFVAVIRILTARSNRDYFFVKVVAFLELLAATVMATGLSFFLFLALFLFFGVATFASSEIRRSALLPRQVVRAARPRFGSRLTVLSVVAALGILVMTAGLFFLLPRTARAAFRHLAQSRYKLPGFATQVQLGQTGEIKLESTPVMHVRLEGVEPNAPLKWRGGALNQFDGRRWFNIAQPGQILRLDRADLRLAEPAQLRRPGLRISYEVALKTLDTDMLFFTGRPEFLRIGLPMIIRMPQDTYRTGLGYTDGLRYFAYSFLARDPLAPPENAPPPSPVDFAAELRLPAIDPRIPELARQVTRNQLTDAARAYAIEQHFRSQYRYTTRLLDREVADPLAHFLFERREGHCEYYASAMAVLLRTLGIPSRVATGFQNGQFNPMTGWHVIRASDAHSWVEAYVAGQGWTAYDPTPAGSGNDTPALWSRLQLYLDAADTFWNEWVLRYDLDRQFSLVTRVEESSRTFRLWWLDRLDAKVNSGVQQLGRSWQDLLLGLVSVALAWMAFPMLKRWWQSFRRQQRVIEGRGSPSDATLLYLQMLELMRAKGYEKPSWVTPNEFSRVVRDAQLKAGVEAFTRAYYEVRFGGKAEAGTRLIEALRALETIPGQS